MISLSQRMASQDETGRAPWDDQPHKVSDAESRKAAHDARYSTNITADDELREALSDGQWHPIWVAEKIAARHGVARIMSMLDRAGVCLEGDQILLARAAR